MNQKPKSIEDRFKQYYTDKELPQDVLVDLKNQIDHSLDVQEESTSSPFPPSGLTGFYHARSGHWAVHLRIAHPD